MRSRDTRRPGATGRHRHAVWLAIATSLAVAGLGVPNAAADPPSPHPGGFWKCLSNSPVRGEFGGQDPIGLASGHHIPTDCAIHWSDGHGKIYCFASLPSLNVFDSDPELLSKAEAFWRKEQNATAASSEHYPP